MNPLEGATPGTLKDIYTSPTFVTIGSICALGILLGGILAFISK